MNSSLLWEYAKAIIPTIVVCIFFYFLIKSILESDRRERIAQAKWEAENPGSYVRPRRPTADDRSAQGITEIREIREITRDEKLPGA